MAVNKSPIILISISKLLFETVESVHLQLDTLYCYLIGILSKSVIDKHFNNRLNYDLRRILSPLDFENLDELCLNLTYGIQTPAIELKIPLLDYTQVKYYYHCQEKVLRSDIH